MSLPLPIELIHHIFEYNADHRSMFYLVQRELIQKVVHRLKMKPVILELNHLVNRYGCLKCKNCDSWFDVWDTMKDPIFGKPIFCNSQCKLEGMCKVLPKLREYYRGILGNSI